MRISLLQEDLDRGRRYSAWESPLGYACARAFGAEYAFVGSTVCLNNGIRIDLGEWKVGLELLTAFERGEKLTPMEIPLSAESVYSVRKIKN